MQIQSELPENWRMVRSTEDNFPSGNYQHEYLDIEVTPSRIKVEGEFEYSFFLQWSSDYGGVEGSFEPDVGISSEEEAKNWMLALMTQIEKQYTPGTTDYVDRAMQATEGKELSEQRSGGYSEAETCPACGALFYHFQGFDSHEQAQNHFEFMDDEEHEGWEVSLEKR
jgi:hypothetical protein